MSIVTLDSQILIWGIKEEASAGQENKIPHAKRFIQWLDENGDDVILSSIVLGELLMRVPTDKHAEVLNFYEKKFKIMNYDSMAASCYATIWQKKNEDKTLEYVEKKLNATRQECKADCQIVACAVARKIDIIYTYDGKLAKFAEGFVETRQMPDIGTQGIMTFQ